MTKNKTDPSKSFFKSTFILVIAIVVVKLIGAIFKIPLNRILGGVGSGYFSTAYEIYNPLENLATAGFPIAISQLVSENMEKGRYRDVRLIHRISVPLFLTTGTISFIIMLAGSFFYVNVAAKVPGALQASLALSPTVLFVCLMSIYRGYYQGLGNMVPTATSEVIEAVSKLVIGLTGSYFVTKLIKDNTASYAAAAAILGVTSGAFIGLSYLIARHKFVGDGITKSQLKEAPKSIGSAQMIRRLVRVAVPIGIGALIMSVAGLIDSTLVVRRIDHIMHTNPQALLNMYENNIPTEAVAGNKVNSFLYGCFGYVTTITMIIPSLTQVFGISALPAVTTAWTRGCKKQLKRSIESVLRLTTMVTIPAGMLLATFGEEIIRFLYESPRTIRETNVASGIVTIMGIATIFSSISTPVCSMLQAVGRVDLPAKLLSIGMLIKIILNYTLVGIPEINIQGAGVGTLFCYAFVTVTALYFLFKETNILPNLVVVFLKPIIASTIVCVTGKVVEQMLMGLLSTRIVTLISLAICIVLYVILLFLFQSITKFDILMLPKGEKIIKVLEKYFRIR